MASPKPRTPKYTDDFFTSHEEAVFQSARVIVPLVMDYVRPKTVVDIGCGRGEWLSVFHEHGVSVQGIDGPYIDRNKLFICGDRFRACNLTRPFRIDGRYDLACCLEVAEHLPERAAKPLVQQLVHAAPVVLFSAAVPGQGGENHMNEQWPAYWREMFSSLGYTLLDIRPLIMADRRVEWYYRQNIMMFASPRTIETTRLIDLHTREGSTAIEWVAVQTMQSYYRPKFAARHLMRSISQRISGIPQKW